MWIPFFIPTLLEIEGGKSFRPRQCTNWSILLQRCCRHLRSTSKKSRGRFKWYIEELFHPQIHRFTVLDLCYTLAHLHVLPESDFRRYFILDKAKRTLQRKKKRTLRKKKTHLADRCWTMKSNFSLPLYCAACPDNLVHMWRLSGSN